jgi:hypothetical protein
VTLPSRTARLALVALCVTGAVAASALDAMAQSWWPWSQQDNRPPVPREPMRQPSPDRPLPPGQPGYPGPPPPYAQQRGGPSNLCLQLEQRLVSEMQGNQFGREALPKIESDIRELERTYRSASRDLDRSDCWDQFLFSKTLRQSRRCIQLNADVENAQRRIADLDRQRRQIMGTGERSSMQDDIVRELARNGCGQQYNQEARKRDQANNPFAMLFGSNEDTDAGRGPTNQFSNLPFATYRTICVRLCDGYYFPVSFSTLPNHFQRDVDVCQSRCAAPADLYYHQNPGGAVEQAMSATTQRPYIDLKVAFRYRKEYVPGCSCKQAEYNPTLDKKAAELAPQTPMPAPGTGVRVGAKK